MNATVEERSEGIPAIGISHIAPTAVALITSSVNLYVLLATCWIRKPTSANLLLCISLVASDAWSALMFVVMFVNQLLSLKGVYVSTCVRVVSLLIHNAATIVCLLHLSAIAINQLFSICNPIRHKLTATRRRTFIAIFIMWLVPLLAYLLAFTCIPDAPLLAPRCRGNNIQLIAEYRLGQTIIILSTFVITVLCYGYILRLVMRRRANQQVDATGKSNSSRLAAGHLDAHRGSTRITDHRSHRQAIITTGLITASCAVGYLPICVANQLICISGCLIQANLHRRLSVIVNSIGIYLSMTKLLANAIIYALRLTEVREAVTRMHAQCRCRLGEYDYGQRRGSFIPTKTSKSLIPKTSKQRDQPWSGAMAPKCSVLSDSASYHRIKDASSNGNAEVFL